MKKIIASCSILAMIASCTAIFAGGPDRLVVAAPPSPVDFFSGFTVAIISSFWNTQFDIGGAGKIACSNLLPIQTFNTDTDILTISETCITPGFTLTNISAEGQEINTFPNVGTAPIPVIFSVENNGNGNDQTGAIGIQASYGFVLVTDPLSYYLAVYGGAQWGNASDNITSTDDLSIFNFDTSVLSTLTNLKFPKNARIEEKLHTQVAMKNVYDVGGQIGVLFTPQTIGYIKGGIAWSKISTHTSISGHLPAIDLGNGIIFDTIDSTIAPIDIGESLFNNPVNLSGHSRTASTDTELAFEAGFGFSQAFTENFIFSLEYMYRAFGKVSAGPGNFFVPFDLRADNINSGSFDTFFNLLDGTLVEATGIINDTIQDPLFYQASSSSVKIHQSVVNAILSYRFVNLF